MVLQKAVLQPVGASLTSIGEQILAYLEGTGIGSTIARGLAGFAVGAAAGDIINFFTNNPDKKAKGHALKYAIVDMHNNSVIKLLTPKQVYSFLNRPKHHRFNRRKVEFIVSPSHETLTKVK